MKPPCRLWLGRAVRLAFLLALSLLAGCNTKYGKLTGQVRLGNEPLPGGRLTFRPANPKYNSVTAPIGPDGAFEVTLPVGESAVSVDNRELQPPTSGQLPHLPKTTERKTKRRQRPRKSRSNISPASTSPSRRAITT
jgi:hypothetical protein